MAAYRRRPLLSCHRIRSSPSTRGHKIRIVSDRFKFLEGTAGAPGGPILWKAGIPSIANSTTAPSLTAPILSHRRENEAGAFRAAGTRAKDRLSSLRHENLE